VNRTDRADRADDPLDDFERRILVKAGAAEVLARTLEPGKLGHHSLVIGTATDPYQPAERKFRVTRGILEMLLHYRGLSIGIITISALVARDAPLLRELTERHDVSVNISVATLDAKLARRLEPRSPVPRARLRALRTLTSAGVHAGLLIAPILPGITDDTAGLTALMDAGRDHGARYAVGSPLRLSETIRQRFLPMLRREFPDLVEKYERHYHSRDYVSRAYHQALKQRLAGLQRKLGYPVERAGERMGNRQ
jgi:DNA repair photolyase